MNTILNIHSVNRHLIRRLCIREFIFLLRDCYKIQLYLMKYLILNNTIQYQNMEPLVWKANVSPDIVDSFITEFSQLISEHYNNLIANGNSHWNGGAIPGYPFRDINIPKNRRHNGVQYLASWLFTIDKLSSNTGIGNFLITLSRKIIQAGFSAKEAEVRFEKGIYYNVSAPQWHMDGGENSIIILYGSQKNWTTHILDDKELQRIFPQGHTSGTIQSNKENADIIKDIEASSTLAEFDHFYNVIKVLHRSPSLNEVGDNLTSDDYRLFIRFTGEE